MSLFIDHMNSVALRMREQEAATATVPLITDAPYVLAPELEGIVYAALLQTMREVPNVDYQGFDLLSIQKVIGPNVASGFPGVHAIAWPLNAVRVLGANVDGQATVAASPAAFVQALNMVLPINAGRYTNRYSFVGGKCLYVGNIIDITFLVEPTLAAWKAATRPVLPIGYDIRVVDLAHKRVLISDYVPAWRP